MAVLRSAHSLSARPVSLKIRVTWKVVADLQMQSSAGILIPSAQFIKELPNVALKVLTIHFSSTTGWITCVSGAPRRRQLDSKTHMLNEVLQPLRHMSFPMWHGRIAIRREIFFSSKACPSGSTKAYSTMLSRRRVRSSQECSSLTPRE